VQTVPGKGWNTILRLYGPLETVVSTRRGDRERSSCSHRGKRDEGRKPVIGDRYQ